MSGAKRLLEDQESKRDCATDIAIESGAAKRCWVHEEVLIEGQPVDVALEHGIKLFKAGTLSGTFKDMEEMEDYIREVVGETSECCYRCEDPD